MAVRVEPNTNEVGVCFFDISTSKCFLGRFTDDINFASFRTLASQVNAVEVVIEKDSLPQQLMKIILNLSVTPAMNKYTRDKCISIPKI